MLQWRCQPFSELSTEQLHAILHLRRQVFVIEQACDYQDIDGCDEDAMHLFAEENNTLVAYCRLLPPGKKYTEPAIGRVCTAQTHRGLGIGRILMAKALQQIAQHHPGQAVRISAQCYLQEFYESFGFRATSSPYDEDGILHIDMLSEFRS
ncbi:MAG: GNAT family N-acetyltransferase [Gammaproteobacteria bacterium]|nr:GNAT family N-acetyltransferase [Gammaproteobacteria bacterium]MDP2139363.1 GNAT family N-acetyltransferase [Gammaproteobacteria bacterium]MDP2347278.1 GNAT family N-acetyltransferase [Gammaproteobacteria bacterium]